MLTIKVEESYKQYADNLGITVPENATVMTMTDKDEFLGMGVMRLYDDYAVLDGIYMKEDFRDFSLEYGMGKSLLNVIDLRGILHVASDNEEMEKLLISLKFSAMTDVKNPEELPEEIKNCKMYLNLKGYFLANC